MGGKLVEAGVLIIDVTVDLVIGDHHLNRHGDGTFGPTWWHPARDGENMHKIFVGQRA